ncbi:DUF1697 domain-containing protein [Seonamhaeicola maritimus]|uniref:DUF1697 domain-containing protein n=1 Tax=Seonamhaeicola maritimus TaxID=2591822 RepID=UPI002494D7FC|nr:DUF1697 domain-containing protein [Seonamhaeicola maritimus]
MKTFIALLKGINVGGHKKVPMAELRELLTKSGFSNVRTYIQSGNIFFETLEESYNHIEKIISDAIQNHFGFEVLVLVRDHQDLRRIFDDCPFDEAKKEASYFMMLHDAPSTDLVNTASEKIYEGEEYNIINDCIYYFSEKGFGRSKFNVNFFERKLQTFATARNYKTMIKLMELSS